MILVEIIRDESRYVDCKYGIAPGGWCCCCHCWCHIAGGIVEEEEEEIL